MDCFKCMNLERAFGSRLSEYSEARSAVFYQVSTELAARKKVDMERARNDLEEHQLICALAPRLGKVIERTPEVRTLEVAYSNFHKTAARIAA